MKSENDELWMLQTTLSLLKRQLEFHTVTAKNQFNSIFPPFQCVFSCTHSIYNKLLRPML